MENRHLVHELNISIGEEGKCENWSGKLVRNFLQMNHCSLNKNNNYSICIDISVCISLQYFSTSQKLYCYSLNKHISIIPFL